MNLYQRTRRVLATEGMSGLMRKAVSKALGQPAPLSDLPNPLSERIEQLRAQIPQVQAEYERNAAEFPAKVQALGLGDVSRYYWYHTVDLGDGLVTPGDHDFRPDVPLFQFPADLRGKKALDVGSATGFFSFEMEKRGAEVVAVELPALGAWDTPWEEKERSVEHIRCYHQARSAEEAYHLHLDGPFQFCRRTLHSQVRRCYSSVYDLSPRVLDCDGFDLVFVGDMLLHLMAPLKALAVLAPLCRGQMIITQQLADEDNPTPMALYLSNPEDDGRSWWMPNLACFKHMLRRLGFRDVSVVGHYSGLIRRSWGTYHRAIIHAQK